MGDERRWIVHMSVLPSTCPSLSTSTFENKVTSLVGSCWIHLSVAIAYSGQQGASLVSKYRGLSVRGRSGECDTQTKTTDRKAEEQLPVHVSSRTWCGKDGNHHACNRSKLQ